jgi:hypothetical protein
MKTLLIATLLSVLFLPACNIVGPALVLAEGPPKTEALLRLDSSRTHIVLVDDMHSRLPKRSLRDIITQSAEEALLAEGVLSPQHLIGGRAIQAAMSDDRSGRPKPIASIGKDAGADVVIYVTIDSWGLTRDGRSAAPTAEARVKVIDCVANKRLWPPNDVGYALRVAPASMQGELPIENAAQAKLEQDLARRFGLALAQCFYKHETARSAKR